MASEQERLAGQLTELLFSLLPSDVYLHRRLEHATVMAEQIAAAILDSDVIRERDAEKWDEGFAAGDANEYAAVLGKPPAPNPYRRDESAG